jgi:hypothetical protein
MCTYGVLSAAQRILSVASAVPEPFDTSTFEITLPIRSTNDVPTE